MTINSLISKCKTYCSSPLGKALAISVLSYLVFFYPGVLGDKVIFSGKDASSLHYQSRAYLYERLSQLEFPFWTERIYGGFPIFASLERGYLNPLNVATVLIFGPLESYQVMHLIHYVAGSLGLFFLSRKLKFGSIGFAAANFVLFFSVAQILRQQHFNSVLTIYLMPLLIYLSELAAQSKSKKHTLLSATLFAYMFYLGSFQTLLIVLIGQIIYLSVFVKRYKGWFVQALYYLIFALILMLPGLILTLQLYLDSARPIGAALFTQGSFTPLMLLNLVVPFLYRFGEGYQGVIIHRDFLMHETYFYIGLLSASIALFSFLSLKTSRVKNFATCSIAVGILLAIVGYIPILKSSLPFPFSLFRYWPRGLILVYFPLALLVGKFFSLKNLEVTLNRLKPIIILLVILGIVELFNFKNPVSLAMLRLFFRDDFAFDPSMKMWADLLITSTLFYTLYFIGALKLEYLKLILFGMLLFDVFYFSSIAADRLYVSKEELVPDSERIAKSNKSKTLDLTNNINGDNALYFKFWGVLGYDALVPDKMDMAIKELGFKNSRYVAFVDGSTNRVAVPKLKALGLETLITDRVVVNTRSNFPLKSEAIPTEEIVREEGNMEISLSLAEETRVETFIKNDFNFFVFKDGKTLAKEKGDDIAFVLPAGEQTVLIKYIPVTYYVSSLLSFLLLIPYFYLFRKESFVR